MEKEINIDDLVRMAKNDIEEAIIYKFKSDESELAKNIYKYLFDFYEEKNFSGDVIFTWKSPSLVQDGDYIGKRTEKVENEVVVGNIFPSFITNRKYSLNFNRNACYGDFPHDYFDIYLDHVAKYAYNENVLNIKEYYPLKRAILYESNKKYFGRFESFNDFLSKNYLMEIWESAVESPFSDMEFEQFKKVSKELMKKRGKEMLNKLVLKYPLKVR